MSELSAKNRARLPNSAFAYVDSKGQRRLPIHDEAHVRNALARFNRVRFEDEAARERARTRLLGAAKKHRIVPVGFIAGQFATQTREAAAGRLFIDLGRIRSSGELEQQLRTVLNDPTLQLLRWSDALRAYVDPAGTTSAAMDDHPDRAVSRLARHGQPLAAIVHERGLQSQPELLETVIAAVRLAIENEWLNGRVEARASEAKSLPTGSVAFLLSDIERSTELVSALGDRYAALIDDVRSVLRAAVSASGGREVDARADEFFAAFETTARAVDAALRVQRHLRDRSWPAGAAVRMRMGIHLGRPTLTETGYVGLAVNAAARVCFVGHGGQVLLSGAAHQSLQRTDAHDTSFISLGSHRLHGLPEPMELFQLTVRDLPSEFPPLRTAAEPPG